MKRIFIAGIVGGLILFLWGAVSHMVLPLGEAGLKRLPDEDTALAALRNSTREDGIYFIPGVDMSREMSPQEEAAWNAKFSAGPAGLLILHYPKPGEKPLAPSQLLTEVGISILAAFLLAGLLARIGGSVPQRAGYAVAIAIIGWLTISVPHWNWYHFSSAFTLAEGFDQVAGWLLAGLAIAKIVPARSE